MVQPDTLLGTYRLLGRLGAGGMGEVWKAEDTRLGRIVAIKILPASVAADPSAMGRMKREARTAAQIYHPNIATIHALEEAGERHFIVMEYVEGEPLSHVIGRGPLPEAEVCRIGKSVADALAEAHEKGIVHRDIKPDNIIVSGTRVKVLDFGIAKRIEGSAVDQDEPTQFMTQQGFIVGTVYYMSPEQAFGKALDARTDLFSLGVVLYQAVTGRLPFRGESPTETITKIVRDEPEPPRGVSGGLAQIIRRCLQKNREDRFANARELAGALEAQLGKAPTAPITRAAAPTVITAKRPAPTRRWPWIAGVVALVMVAALAVFVVSRTMSDGGGTTTGVVHTSTARSIPSPPPATVSIEVTPVTVPETRGAPEARTIPVPATVPVATAAPAHPPVVTASPPDKTADDHYNEGVTQLVSRQPRLARESFLAALEKDPHHAKAHFRLGEMALFMRDTATARRELEAALTDGERLDERERKLSELGLAVLDRDRPRAEALLREISAISPRDPDLMRFRELMRGGEQRPFPRRRPRP
jgi:hypothetical protein